ncbi:MAG: DUF6768 family protein [Verrucomicrobiota bacterium]
MKEPELDDLLKNTLNAEERELFAHYSREPGVFSKVGALFRGRNRWLAFYVYFWTLVFFGFGVWCAVQFFSEGNDTLRETVGYATGFLFGMIIATIIKTWFWIGMERNAITREIKRLELAIAKLAK